MQNQTMKSYKYEINIFHIINEMEKHFTSVGCSADFVEVSHVSVGVNDVLSWPGMLVWVGCCVGLIFGGSLGKPAETQATCTVSDISIRLLYGYKMNQEEYLKNEMLICVQNNEINFFNVQSD